MPALPDPAPCATPALSATLRVLAAALDERDQPTNAHCDRVARLACALGVHCDLDERQRRDLVIAARFHDVGKIGIPDGVLLSPAALDAGGWTTMQSHPIRGERLFLATGRRDAARVARLIRHHHEAVDGSGYPDGLRGAEIPLECRILSLVDAYDAMTSHRPYRAPMPHAEAMRRLGDAQGTQIDPDVFREFERLAPRLPQAAA